MNVSLLEERPVLQLANKNNPLLISGSDNICFPFHLDFFILASIHPSLPTDFLLFSSLFSFPAKYFIRASACTQP